MNFQIPFLVFQIFFLFIHLKSKKNISGVTFLVSLSGDQQNKKLIKIIFVNSGYFKSEKEFSIFPLFFFENLRSKGREYLTAFALISYWS